VTGITRCLAAIGFAAVCLAFRCDVARRSPHTDDVAMLITLYLPMRRDETDCAVRENDPVLEVEGASVAQCLAYDQLNALAVVRMHPQKVRVVGRPEFARLESIDLVQLGRPVNAILQHIPFPTGLRRGDLLARKDINIAHL